MAISIVYLWQRVYNSFSRWLLAWKEIGLNSEEEVAQVLDEHDQRCSEMMFKEDKSSFFQEFDLILMTHPTSLTLLPPECQPVPQNFDPGTFRGPGM